MECPLRHPSTTKPNRRLRAYPELFKRQLHPQSPRGSTVRQEPMRPTPQPTPEEDIPRPQYEKVLELVGVHKQYSPHIGETPVLDLPKFEDITKYGLEEEKEQQLWELETKRLFRIFEDESATIEFQAPKDINLASKQTFDLITDAADLIMTNIWICKHDCYMLYYEHCTGLFNAEEYAQARQILSRESSKNESKASDTEKSDTIIRQIYFSLVDYITTVLVRFSLHEDRTEFWYTRCVASLAKHAAKLKYLAINNHDFLEMAIDGAEDLFARDEAYEFMGVSGAAELHNDIFHRQKARSGRLQEIQRVLQTDFSKTSIYCADIGLVSLYVENIMLHLFTTLKPSRVSGLSTTAFDICSLLYEAGLTSSPTLLSQDRDGDITGTTQRALIRNSYSAFKLLCNAVSSIDKRLSNKNEDSTCTTTGSESPQVGAKGPEWAHMTFEFAEEQSPSSLRSVSCRVSLTKTGDIITLFIPLVLAEARAVMELASILHTNNLWNRRTKFPKSDSNSRVRFTAFASLRTSDYSKETQDAASHSDVRPLSKSLMAQGRLHSLSTKIPHGTQQWDSMEEEEKSEVMRRKENARSLLEKQIKDWVFEETAIRVKCKAYVITVLLLCSILVIGGILAGLLVGKRIDGVDPFGISIFTWILSGFVILVAKSIRVNDWPWRDFLSGEVPCRSVSELHSVTGTKEQDILGYLLSRESSNILITQGPYNKAFVRRGINGFGIDVKLELRTMVFNGLIGVKVSTTNGDGLIFLDLRHGIGGRASLQQSDDSGDSDLLSCCDRPESFDEEQEIPLTREKVSWNGILGFYFKENKKFR